MNNIESKPKDLETVKGWLAIARENNNKLAIQIIEDLFPEVQEVMDMRIKEAVLKMVHDTPSGELEDNYSVRKEEILAWLEKQGNQKPIEQDTEIRDLWEYIKEFKEKFGRLPKDEDELAVCIDYVIKRQKPADKVEHESTWIEEDELMIQDAIHWIQEFQKSDRCKYENDMQNSVTCENWLKSFKPQIALWRPSEYDISLLEEIARNIRNNVRPFCSEVSALEDLINNIKTL